MNNSMFLYRNKKKGTIYYVTGSCINCTNAQDGQRMILYTDGENNFCREEKEFDEKFEPVDINEIKWAIKQ